MAREYHLAIPEISYDKVRCPICGSSCNFARYKTSSDGAGPEGTIILFDCYLRINRTSPDHGWIILEFCKNATAAYLDMMETSSKPDNKSSRFEVVCAIKKVDQMKTFLFKYYRKIKSNVKKVLHAIEWGIFMIDDKDFDWYYTLRALQKKINDLHDHIAEHGIIEMPPELPRAKYLINRLVNDKYYDEVNYYKAPSQEKAMKLGKLARRNREEDMLEFFTLLASKLETWWD